MRPALHDRREGHQSSQAAMLLTYRRE
jgi:hypothetical protein